MVSAILLCLIAFSLFMGMVSLSAISTRRGSPRAPYLTGACTSPSACTEAGPWRVGASGQRGVKRPMVVLCTPYSTLKVKTTLNYAPMKFPKSNSPFGFTPCKCIKCSEDTLSKHGPSTRPASKDVDLVLL